MPQTLLAFLAMMIASMASYNHLLAEIRIQEERIHSEFEIMANAVALEAVELQAVPMGFDGVIAMHDRRTQKVFRVDDQTETFDLDWSVQYVDLNGAASIAPTPLREVTVTVTHDRFGTMTLVRHTRIIGDD